MTKTINDCNYGMRIIFNGSFEKAKSSVKEGLAKEGFGILTEIDVSKTLKKKLDLDYPRYLILGACNPSLAYEALQAEKEIGLLLPCNLIIYEEKEEVIVSVMRPKAGLGLIDNPKVGDIAEKVEEKLTKVLHSLSLKRG